jgi:cell division protein FtsL
MSNLAKTLQQETQQQTVKSLKPSVKKLNAWLSPGERVLFFAFGILVCIGAAFIVSKQAAIYEANKEIQLVESSIQEQQKVNRDLEMQISELSTYERIWEKAKELGLTLNENNVKVVQ